MGTINIEIDGDGTVFMETKGFEGAECEDFTEELEKAMGVTEANKRTPEFYLQQSAKARGVYRG
jgi:hypothetical protein